MAALYIFTARKQSLGQGNIFTPVCHSVHRAGHVWLLGGACVVASGGMHGCSGGVVVCGCSGGACMVALEGCVWLLQRACVVAQGGVHDCSWGAVHGIR